MLSSKALATVPKDEHGHPALGLLGLGKMMASTVAAVYKQRTGKERKVNGVQVGYESRCALPHAYDVMLGSQLGIGAYRALIERYPKSRYVPDAWMAFGEYYFNKANKSDRAGNLARALEAYRKAAEYQESSVYGYALYKQAWVHYNLGQWSEALELFRGVIFFGEMPTTSQRVRQSIANCTRNVCSVATRRLASFSITPPTW